MKRAIGPAVFIWAALGIMACGKIKQDTAENKEHKLAPTPVEAAAPASASAEPTVASAPASAPAAPDTVDINRVPQYKSIRELASERYVGCDAPVLCNGLAYFDCNAKQGGQAMYYDTLTVTLVSRCGSDCVNPDASLKAQCDTACPPKAWAGCPGT